MTDVQLINRIFRTEAAPTQEFLVDGFEFVFEDEEPDLDIYYYTITHGKFRMLFAFFGIDSSATCGPLI